MEPCRIVSILLMLLSLALNLYAEEWNGVVVGVTDGDTITVLKSDNEQIKIRLAEIDCPENGQDFSRVAKRFVSDLCFGKEIEVKPTGIDKYGRTVAHIVLPDGTDLSEELLKAGLAWHYKKYSTNRHLGDFEIEARRKKLGVWSMANPTAPWDFRHGQKGVQRINTGFKNQSYEYHGNVSSRIFHGTDCKYYDCKNCTAIFATREEAIKAGYRPCKLCNP